jgi:hypothetical protein
MDFTTATADEIDNRLDVLDALATLDTLAAGYEDDELAYAALVLRCVLDAIPENRCA